MLTRDELMDLLRPLAERLGVEVARLRYVEATPNQVIVWPTREQPIVACVTAPISEPLLDLED